MSGLGMSFRAISAHLKEMYVMDISHDTLSALTEKIVPQVNEWQARPLDSLYCIVWLEAMHYEVRLEGRTVSRVVYNILGIDRHGHKEMLGVYVSESEGANLWLSVLTDLQQRGVQVVDAGDEHVPHALLKEGAKQVIIYLTKLIPLLSPTKRKNPAARTAGLFRFNV